MGNKNIFINIFIENPDDYVYNLKDCLEHMHTLEQLEVFLNLICTKYDTDQHGTTTWCNDKVIVRSGYFKQFSIPLSVSVKENKYGNTEDQIAC